MGVGEEWMVVGSGWWWIVSGGGEWMGVIML